MRQLLVDFYPEFGGSGSVTAGAYYSVMNDDMAARIAPMAAKAIDLFIDSVSQIPPADWENQSNLEQWSVRQLVGHATGSAAKIVALFEGAKLWKARRSHQIGYVTNRRDSCASWRLNCGTLYPPPPSIQCGPPHKGKFRCAGR